MPGTTTRHTACASKRDPVGHANPRVSIAALARRPQRKAAFLSAPAPVEVCASVCSGVTARNGQCHAALTPMEENAHRNLCELSPRNSKNKTVFSARHNLSAQYGLSECQNAPRDFTSVIAHPRSVDLGVLSSHFSA